MTDTQARRLARLMNRTIVRLGALYAEAPPSADVEQALLRRFDATCQTSSFLDADLFVGTWS